MGTTPTPLRTPAPRRTPGPHAAMPGVTPPLRPQRSRPNPNPMRLMLGMVGIATASAFTVAMVPSVVPGQAADAAVDGAIPAAVAAAPAPARTPLPVRKVTRYVTLLPGQTPPPGAATQAQPAPTPIVKTQIVTRTRQSGQP